MFCHHCGQEIDDRSLYCNYCGRNQDEQTDPAAKTASGRTGQRKRLIWWLSGAALLVIAAAAVLLFAGYRPPLERFEEAVAQEDSVTARYIYQQEIEPDEGQRQKAEDFVKARAEELKESYSGPDDYEAIRASFRTLEELGLAEKEVSAALEAVEETKRVTELFENAERCVKKELFTEAMQYLDRVSASSDRHGEAQKRIEEIKPLYYAQKVAELDALMDEGSYDKAQSMLESLTRNGYPLPEGYEFDTPERLAWEATADFRRSKLAELKDECMVTAEEIRFLQPEDTNDIYAEIIFRNNTDKIIRGFSFTYWVTSIDGYMIPSETAGVTQLRVNEPVYPGETFGEGRYWEIMPADVCGEITGGEVCVDWVNFYDANGNPGSSREDPYFKYWNEENYGRMRGWA